MENGFGSEKTRGMDAREAAGAVVIVGHVDAQRWIQQTFKRILFSVRAPGGQATEPSSA